jgi:hypothetical protein
MSILGGTTRQAHRSGAVGLGLMRPTDHCLYMLLIAMRLYRGWRGCGRVRRLHPRLARMNTKQTSGRLR